MRDADLIAAATLLIVRDAPELQVLMVERHHQVDFVAGALVFPGGKTRAEDHIQDWLAHIDGANGLSDAERAARICAVRESFEESGLLLARRRDARGPDAALCDGDAIVPLQNLRAAIDKGEESFLRAISAAGLVLALDTLSLYAHWITPRGMPKRFDTLFFIAAAPPAQIETCDGCEAVEALWVSPHEALADAAAKRRQIVFPTRLNLALLGEAHSAAAACAQAKQRVVVTVTPEITNQEGVAYLQIPAEAGYGDIKVKLSEA
jgi:8-oxo-dGTP pyrophosphatase MutT (NUDIX family)